GGRDTIFYLFHRRVGLSWPRVSPAAKARRRLVLVGAIVDLPRCGLPGGALFILTRIPARRGNSWLLLRCDRRYSAPFQTREPTSLRRKGPGTRDCVHDAPLGLGKSQWARKIRSRPGICR